MGTPTQNDEQIKELFDSGNHEALSKLYDKYAPSLFGFISGIVSNNQIAEETLEHCFLEVWNRISNYNASKERLFVWMFKIARTSAKYVSGRYNLKIKENDKYSLFLMSSNNKDLENDEEKAVHPVQ